MMTHELVNPPLDTISCLHIFIRADDIQIQTGTGEVVITNDGATILKHMAVLHPAARMVRHQSVSDFFPARIDPDSTADSLLSSSSSLRRRTSRRATVPLRSLSSLDLSLPRLRSSYRRVSPRH